MLDLLGLGAVAAAFFVAAASPGPATIAVATVSMSAGRACGLRFGYGLSIGLAFWGLVAATGLGAVLQASSVALSVLKLLGGAYLLWLAYGTVRSADRDPVPQNAPTRRRNHFRRGLLLNLSNPKAVLAWMAALALGLNPKRPRAGHCRNVPLWCVGLLNIRCLRRRVFDRECHGNL